MNGANTFPTSRQRNWGDGWPAARRGSRVPLLALGGLAAVVGLRLLRSGRAYDLRGKTVLVTGGSRGLGLVLARELAHQGARVVICARDLEELNRAFEDLVARGAHVLAVPCDVTDRR